MMELRRKWFWSDPIVQGQTALIDIMVMTGEISLGASHVLGICGNDGCDYYRLGHPNVCDICYDYKLESCFEELYEVAEHFYPI